MIRYRGLRIKTTLTLLLAIGALKHLQAAEGDVFLRVELIASDSEILVDDGICYKVVITNVSRSTVTVAAPTAERRYSCVIESRTGEGDWRIVLDDTIHAAKGGTLRLIKIAPDSTWAEYGPVFFTAEKNAVFHEVGVHHIRAKVTTAIGVYRSDPVQIKVIARPEGETPLDERFASCGRVVLFNMTGSLERHQSDLSELCKRHRTGSVAKSFKMLLDLASYEKDGTIAGKAATRAEAFKTLAEGLDGVRRDQLAMLLGYGAYRNKQWGDLDSILKEFKGQSSQRASLQGDLDTAIQQRQFQPR